MICQKCGKEIPDRARFCPYCQNATQGQTQKLTKEQQAPNPQLQGKKTQNPQQQGQQVSNPHLHDPQMAGWAKKQPPRKEPPVKPVTPTPTPEATPTHKEKGKKTRRASKKRVLILSGTILALLVATALALLLFFMAPANQAIRALDSGDYSQAVEIINEMDEEDLEEDSEVVKAFQETLDQICQDYENEKITYEEASSQLEELSGVESPLLQQKVQAAIDRVEMLHESRENYAEGQKQYEADNYADALELLKKVPEEDSVYYPKAVDLIAQVTADYEESMLQAAADKYNNGKYRDAIVQLQTGQKAFPDDEEFVTKCDGLIDEYTQKWYNTALKNEQYFGSDGAVTIAQDMAMTDVDLNELIQEGLAYEEDQLWQKVNDKREDMGESGLIRQDALDSVANDYVQTLASQVANAGGDSSLFKVDEAALTELLNGSSYPYASVDYTIAEGYTSAEILVNGDASAEEEGEDPLDYSFYGNLDNIQDAEKRQQCGGDPYRAYGEFNGSNLDIGIAMCYDSTSQQCYWLILTAVQAAQESIGASQS